MNTLDSEKKPYRNKYNIQATPRTPFHAYQLRVVHIVIISAREKEKHAWSRAFFYYCFRCLGFPLLFCIFVSFLNQQTNNKKKCIHFISASFFVVSLETETNLAVLRTIHMRVTAGSYNGYVGSNE